MNNNRYNNNFTQADYDFIKENYQKFSVAELARKLNKCQSGVYKTIQKLHLEYDNRDGKVWTEQEVEFLKQNIETHTVQEIANKLRRTKKSVQGKMYGLGIKKSKTTNWTEIELNYLRDNINSKSYTEIAKNLNRTMSSIYNKVWELQLIDDEYKNHRKLKKEQIQFIILNCLTMTDYELAKKFNVSIETIEDIRKKYGIKKDGNSIHGSTYIEKFVMDILDEYNIPYLYNKPLDDYYPDFQICDSKIIIEVQGDYFHCNPYIYRDGPKDEIQIRHIIKDYYKKCHFLSRGYTIIYIWELEINQNPNEVKDRILKEVCRP